MNIVIDTYKEEIWKTKYTLSKAEMKNIIVAVFKHILKNNCSQKNDLQTYLQDVKNVFLDVSFVDAKTITEYNKQYRQKDSITNVLSFENKTNKFVNDNLFLGEMVLCFEKIKQEAEEYNKTFKERLYHLFVHSILHLLGYDHIVEEDRVVMEKLEEDILKEFNIFNPYFC